MATTYRIRFNNVEEQAIEGTLTDETGDLDIIDIEGAEDAIRIVSQDNDESKYSPIKAKKCVMKFLNSLSVNVRTFSIGEDSRWLVTVKINSLTVFVGHLEQGDIEEPFQYEENQIVVLTATDGLGVLKTHRLEDIYNVWTTSGSGCGPNENRIIDYIAACLGASGLELTINVINNLREQDNDDTTDPTTFGNMYATLYLDIKTFEDQQIGQYLNCYDVLEKILGHDCYLTQAKGQWWIIRVTELRQDFDMIKTVFDFDGTALSFETLNYEKAIGLKDVNDTPFPGTPDATAYFSQEKTMLTLQRPVKYVTLKYGYENPFEILNNSIFSRGDFVTNLPDETNADGETLTVQAYETDCWTYQKHFPTPVTNDSTAYIIRRYLNGNEVERFARLLATATSDPYFFISAQRIRMNLNDKFQFTFALRFENANTSGSDFQLNEAAFNLYADDGTIWNLYVTVGSNQVNPGNYWVQTDLVTPTTVKSLLWQDFYGTVDGGLNMQDWNTLSFTSAPLPRSGKLEVIFLNQDDPNLQYKEIGSVNLSYIPYINGSYNIFSAQSDTSTRDGEYFSSIEDDVFITNSPTPIFKGALLKPVLGEFVIVDKFYEGQQYNQTTGPDHLATYGELRVRAYHNQFRNGDEIYRATCQGLGQGVTDGDGQDDHQDLIHRYFNRDIEPVTNGRVFQLVNQDVDLRNCEWFGTLIKNFDIFIGFVDDTYTFSYGAPGGGQTGGSGGGGGPIPPSGGGARFGVAGEDETATQSRAFNADTFGVFIYGANGGTILSVDQASDPGTAISGSSVGAAAISAFSNGSIVGAINGQVNNSNTDTALPIEILVASSDNTADVGFGASIDFQLQDATTASRESNRLISEWTDATDLTRTSRARLTGTLSGVAVDVFTANSDGSWDIRPITATGASAITPTEGKFVFVSTTNGTFTSIGLWCYENGAWSKK